MFDEISSDVFSKSKGIENLIHALNIIKNEKDLSFKPGLFNQVKAFLNNDLENFCTIREQKELMKVYNEIANYNN